MKELKKKTMEVINAINNDWVTTLKVAAENNEGVDLTEMMGKFSKNISDLDDYFRDAEERIKIPKKKGFFGRGG